jgi:cell division protein FtsN
MEQDFAKRRTRTPLAEPSPVAQPSSLGLLLTGLVTGIAVGLFIALMVYLSGALPPAPGHVIAPDSREIETPDIATTDSEGGLTQEQQREAQRLQLEFYQELPNYEVVVNVTPVEGAVLRTPAAAVANTDSSPVAETGTAVEISAAVTDDTTSASLATVNTETQTAAANPVERTDPVSAALLEISNRAPVVPAAVTAQATSQATAPATTAADAGPSFMLQAGAFQQQATANTQLNRLLGLGLNARIREETLPGRTLYLVQAGPYDSRDDMMQAERVLRSNSIDSMRITLSQP